MAKFHLVSKKSPAGDQPKAIEFITEGINKSKRHQLLLGVTGSGKTFTIANIINNVGKKTLILTHNKTLAAQWYQELKELFPENSVQYYISFYDFYRPESFIPRTGTYLEKESVINAEINKMRLNSLISLATRPDTIIVSSISCIFEAGNLENFKDMVFKISVGEKISREDLKVKLTKGSFAETEEIDLPPSSFRSVSETIDIHTLERGNEYIKIRISNNEIVSIYTKNKSDKSSWESVSDVIIYPSSAHVYGDDVFRKGMESIKHEMEEWCRKLKDEGKTEEAIRLEERTLRDLEIMAETHTCHGIENYSIHFSSRKTGDPPNSLLDFIDKDGLLIIDESHQTIPQMRSMHKSTFERINKLVNFGYRLPSAHDNRPLKFEEALKKFPYTVYVSATPSEWEVTKSKDRIAEQIIRPTGLLDPSIEVLPTVNQIEDSVNIIKQETKKNNRCLVISLTKKMAEKISKYLKSKDIKSCYIHSGIKSQDRTDIINDLRSGNTDVIVGVNLLREGIDLPEVTVVLVLDADQEGFLRSATSLMQICGRAARNKNGRVVLFADKMTKSICETIDINNRRRERQDTFNKENNISPETTFRSIASKKDTPGYSESNASKQYLKNEIKDLTEKMEDAALNHKYKEAILLRNKIKTLKKILSKK